MIEAMNYQDPVNAGFFTPEEKPAPKDLRKFLSSKNIAKDLEEVELGKIGTQVCNEFDIDENSRSTWKLRYLKALDIAMQAVKERSDPWPGAANVSYPLLTTAAIQFNARSYPAIVTNNLVKVLVRGEDKDQGKQRRADRVQKHMSNQILNEIPGWEESTDRLLMMISIIGCLFKKTYYCPIYKKIKSELILPDKLVVDYSAVDIETVPRITHVISLYPSEIEARIRTGAFVKFDYQGLKDDNDDYKSQEFYEQHRYLDLDDDNMPEPYIVTVHKESQRVVRIIPRFDAKGIEYSDDKKIIGFKVKNCFTKFGFLPALDGGFYSSGFADLLLPINNQINSTINQMLNAGYLQSTAGGLIGRGIHAQGGRVQFSPGEFIHVDTGGMDLSKNIVPFNFPGPSPVLFNLLGFLVDAGKDISSIKDILTGDTTGANESPTTVMARIEQGLKVFSGIHKRIYLSLTNEFKKIFELNAEYLPQAEYQLLLDDPEAISSADYSGDDLDVYPSADPSNVTDMQKMAKANFLLQTFRGDPLINQEEIVRRVLEASSITELDKLILPPSNEPPMEAKFKLAELRIKNLELENKALETQAKVKETEERIINMRVNSINTLATAEKTEQEISINQNQASIDSLMGELEFIKKQIEVSNDNEGGIRDMEGESDYSMGNELPEEQYGSNPEGLGSGVNEQAGAGGVTAVPSEATGNLLQS